MKFSRILMICQGNICRSPTAEWLLKDRLQTPEVTVASAGLTAMVGHPPPPEVLQLLASEAIDAQTHRAQQVTPELLSGHDLVLVMEQMHLEMLTRLDPVSRGKTKLLGHWAGGIDVPDPYRRSLAEFEACHQQISLFIDQWLPYLD